MKKNLLPIILCFTFLYSEATDTTLRSLHKISESKVKLRFNNIEKLSGLEFIPTLIRSSYKTNNAWEYNSNIKLVIENQQKVASIELSNSLVDTISRRLYTYDQLNRLTSETLEETNQFGMIVPRRRFIHSYTSLNNESTTTTIIENFDQQTSSWVVNYKHIRTHNSRGALIKSADYSFSDNMWLIENYYSTKITYINNNSSKTTEIIDSTFHFITGSMLVYRKILTSYDAQERETEIKIFYPISNGYELVLDEVDSFYYSNSQIPDNIVRYTYYDNGDVENRFKFADINFKKFDHNLSVFENEFQSYLIYYFSQNKYELSSRYSVSYPDNYGSRIELLEQYDGIFFKPAFKNNYLYNTHYHLIEESSQKFDFSTYYWETEQGYRYLYNYDTNNNTTELLTQYYNDNVKTYLDMSKYEYSDFQLVNTSIKNTSIGSLNIYPNPVKGHIINIQLSLKESKAKTLRILNLQGAEVMKNRLYLADMLNIEGLQTGIYLLEITTDKGDRIISKFIKE